MVKPDRKVLTRLQRFYRYVHHHPEHWIHAASAGVTFAPSGLSEIAHTLHSVHYVSAAMVLIGFLLYLLHIE